ncbi:MAG: hypothetical protein JJV95_06110 [Sulfurospirillum sp.]|nr:hypothetical protein [Sulfurospirillum sp.]MBL0703540.1 hypothetical protein [Sulfurospirillum sp.]
MQAPSKRVIRNLKEKKRQQCKLIGLSRSSIYYEPSINENKLAIKKKLSPIEYLNKYNLEMNYSV